jgi:drug/metabolite transporter (DMT)-like permease
MGIHFIITLIGGAIIDANGGPDAVPKFVASLFYTDFQILDFVYYLPVAGLYILAMVLGYIGLRYIELSISSPICNCSGSLALLLCAIIFPIIGADAIEFDVFTIIGVVAITLGIIAMGVVDNKENEELKILRRQESNRKYTKSILAFLLPIAYLIIDALGTVGDEVFFHYVDISDYSANSAFELTFFLLAIFSFVWVQFVKKDKVFAKKGSAVYLGGLCETIGQVFYMAVMFADYEIGMPIISAYCVVSVLWSRIFLKEKLSIKHYIAIGVTIAGIILLGIFSPV